jgi:hypothetical protein
VELPLIRECYQYVDLREPFLAGDVAAYAMFRNGGIAERWLTEEVHLRSSMAAYGPVTVHVSWYPFKERRSSDSSTYSCSLSLDAKGPLGLSGRRELVSDWQATFPGVRSPHKLETQEMCSYSFEVGVQAGAAADRRRSWIGSILESPGTEVSHEGRSFTRLFQYNRSQKAYLAVAPEGIGMNTDEEMGLASSVGDGAIEAE